MGITLQLLTASKNGRIHPRADLEALVARGSLWQKPEPGELVPLPAESEIFLLPGRRAAGMDAKGDIVVTDDLTVAAFAAPGYTLSAHPAFQADDDAPMLPLFAYGAVGYAKGKMWICATKVDDDPRQQFADISPRRIARDCRALLKAYPDNRLVGHIINNCALRYDCPAARNFALGRYEAPLPTSRSCNARCVGCISARQPDSPLSSTPQCRMEFTPTVDEIVEVMQIHEKRERHSPVYSFGQGCEGDPLMNPSLLAESVAEFRGRKGKGTINCNSNASRPDAVEMLAKAGLTSLRVSLNSARPEIYHVYYRPCDYDFFQVEKSIRLAANAGVFVSLNLLYFPGVTDTEEELQALARLCGENDVSMIQWRNMNIDPDWYWKIVNSACPQSGPMGLSMFMKKLRELCPWLRYGYFNPWLG